jgi:DNA-binding NtrC family response regulator
MKRFDMAKTGWGKFLNWSSQGEDPTDYVARWASEPPPTTEQIDAKLEQMADELVALYISQYCRRDHFCLKKLMEIIERVIISHVLRETYGNQRSAADKLGIKPTTLHYKIHRMGLTPPRNRPHIRPA